MTTIEQRISTAVSSVEYAADIGEKFIDPDQLTDIPTNKGPVKSIAQLSDAIDAHIDVIKELIDGKLSFKTRADMLAYSPVGNPQAWVWDDPVFSNNGLYGWDGSEWIFSKLDTTLLLNSLSSSAAKSSAAVDVFSNGLSQYVETVEQSIEPAIISESTNQSLLGFDENGKAHLDLHPDSVRSISTLNPDKYTVEDFNVAGHSSDVVFAVTDDAPTPNILAQLTADGNWNFSNQFNDFGNKKLINRPILYHIICDGQSRSVGYGAVPGLTDPSDVNSMVLMPEGGVRSKAFDSLSPLSELGSVQQSPSGGIAQSLFDYMGKDGVNLKDVDFRFALSNPGTPNTKIEKFVTGGDYESHFYDQVRYAKLAADSMDLDYQIHAFGWIQGGADRAADTSYQDYYDMLISLLVDRENGVNTLLNRSGVKLHMLLAQYDDVKNTDNLDIINAHRDAANNNENIHLVCPLYMLNERPDGLHFSNVQSKWLGKYMALAYQQVVIEGKEWLPLQPIDISTEGMTITIEFDVPRAPLEFDTEHLKTIGDQGFIVSDDNGVVAITDISIVRGTAVEITIGRALSANPRVSYARKFTNNGGGLTGDNPRGLLRDSAGYDNVYKEGAVVLPMHNWCLTFDESINLV